MRYLQFTISALVAFGFTVVTQLPAQAADPAVKCQAGQLKEAGKYGFCRFKAHAKSVKKGIADFTKCDLKLTEKWGKLESKAGGACPSQGDVEAARSEATGHSNSVSAALAGTPEQAKCEAAKLKEAGKYGFCLLKAESKGVKKGVPADVSKCDSKFASKWSTIESKFAPNCPTTGDVGTVQAAAQAHRAAIVALAAGGPTACPTQLYLKTLAGFGAVPTGTRIETGWNGQGHKRDLLDDYPIKLAVTCANPSPPCGVCTIDGLSGKFGRCANDVTLACDAIGVEDIDDCGVGNYCVPSLYPPSPWSVANAPVCVQERLRTDVSGTFNNETGDAAISVGLSLDLSLGLSLTQPCATCDGDVLLNDGNRDGTCNGGSRDGLPCDANGTNPTWGATSFDCPTGFSLGVLPVRTLNLTTGSVALGAGVPCGGLFGTAGFMCPCALCSGDVTVACSSDAECAAIGAGTCSANTGAGATRQPNACANSGFVCSDTGDGVHGECASDTDEFCDGELLASGDGYLLCLANADCAALGSACGVGGCGDCTLTSQRSCFLPTIMANGSADPNSPLLVDVGCVGASGSSGVNLSLGLPGPERSGMRFSIVRIP